jgi:hypothetical protein
MRVRESGYSEEASEGFNAWSRVWRMDFSDANRREEFATRDIFENEQPERFEVRSGLGKPMSTSPFPPASTTPHAGDFVSNTRVFGFIPNAAPVFSSSRTRAMLSLLSVSRSRPGAILHEAVARRPTARRPIKLTFQLDHPMGADHRFRRSKPTNLATEPGSATPAQR